MADPAEGRRLLQDLVARGHAPSYAGTGGEAIDELKWHRFDAVLIDKELPDTDGFDFLARLCEETHMPILMTSASPLAGEDIKASALGAEGYLVKPLDVPSLDQLLRLLTEPKPGQPVRRRPKANPNY
jgi:DNA-binding response OmpR family regulator